MIGDYARGDTAPAADVLWALEAHLEACATCRGRLAAAVATEAPVTAALVDTVRAQLAPQLAAAAPRSARRYRPNLVPRRLTPVAAPWLGTALGCTLLALLLGAVAAPVPLGHASLLVLVAPVLPLGAVAASWSRPLDPVHELTASTARAGLPLLLRRTTAVLAVVVPVLLLGGGLTGTTTAGQWLLPSLAFTATALALGSVVGLTRAALALLAAWCAAVAVPAWFADRVPLVLQPGQLPGWGLLLAIGTAAVIVRRHAYEAL
ncbi:hypothetical protein C7C46_00605 [Streptomyces tateyamensis]|uniref:Zinc-finger domain-containing protein n=1 Tax=Streptomyces tateyamensis TaxID=565073 RepID=A0A2V4PTD6_9ACTN|nr:hypothetical protein C7C46_00605 [Streptomyces tateyamensis]